MILLICNSNMFVPGVVTRVLKSPQEQFLIYTDMPGMETFFKEMVFTNAVILRYPNSYTLRTLSKTKKYMLEQLKPYSISRIEFYHTEAGQLANWLISKYAKRNCDIVYCPPYKPFPFKKLQGIKRWKLIILDKILYHYDVDPLVMGSNGVISSLADSFFEKNKISKGKYSVDNELNSNYIVNRYSNVLSRKKVALLTGSIITCGGKPDEYNRIIEHILEKVGKDNVVTKCHPLFNDEYGVETTLPRIPSYIPFNVILPLFDVVIGYGSTAIVEAAEEGKIAISLVFLVPFKDEKIPLSFYESLKVKTKAGTIVHYPKSLEELDVLLTSL